MVFNEKKKKDKPFVPRKGWSLQASGSETRTKEKAPFLARGKSKFRSEMFTGERMEGACVRSKKEPWLAMLPGRKSTCSKRTGSCAGKRKKDGNTVGKGVVPLRYKRYKRYKGVKGVKGVKALVLLDNANVSSSKKDCPPRIGSKKSTVLYDKLVLSCMTKK